MAFDSFLYFQGASAKSATSFVPQGETTDPQFSPYFAFEIKSFNFSAQNNVTIGSATQGAGAGKVVLEKFKFQKTIDSGSVTLFTACASGKHFPAAVLVLRKAGGVSAAGQSNPCYLVYKFLFCYIDTISWSGSSGDDVPTEDVSFAYGAMSIQYMMQSTTGQLTGTPYQHQWSQVMNKPVFAVTGAAGGISGAAIDCPVAWAK